MGYDLNITQMMHEIDFDVFYDTERLLCQDSKIGLSSEKDKNAIKDLATAVMRLITCWAKSKP